MSQMDMRTKAAKMVDMFAPDRIKRMPRDKRGFPILYTLARKHGKDEYDFTQIDGERVTECASKRLCGVCGEKMNDMDYWFISGPLSSDYSFYFTDPAMHEECARFALMICPWMVMSEYRRSKPAQAYIGSVLTDSRPPILSLSKACCYGQDKDRGILAHVVDVEYCYAGRTTSGDQPTREEIDKYILEQRAELFGKLVKAQARRILAATMIQYEHMEAEAWNNETHSTPLSQLQELKAMALATEEFKKDG